MNPSTKLADAIWDAAEVGALVRAALDEDLRDPATGRTVDLTAESLVAAGAAARARIVAKQELVVAGLPLVERVFRALDRNMKFEAKAGEGAQVAAGAALAEMAGNAHAILSGERTALNFLGHLCGVATLTRRFVEAVRGTGAKIRDTRKTTALQRALEKYAVRMGGGVNHRMGLFDAMLIKENHIALAGGIRAALEKARQRVGMLEPAAARAAVRGAIPDEVFPEMTAYEAFEPPVEAVEIEVEVRNEAELREALEAGADAVLLDNMTPHEAARLVCIARGIRPACALEVSGGVNLTNVRAYAEAGVDFIAIGALTHSAPAADLSLLVEAGGVR